MKALIFALLQIYSMTATTEGACFPEKNKLLGHTHSCKDAHICTHFIQGCDEGLSIMLHIRRQVAG